MPKQTKGRLWANHIVTIGAELLDKQRQTLTMHWLPSSPMAEGVKKLVKATTSWRGGVQVVRLHGQMGSPVPTPEESPHYKFYTTCKVHPIIFSLKEKREILVGFSKDKMMEGTDTN